jgi:predicted ATP-dependent endonuclease of OLD family
MKKLYIKSLEINNFRNIINPIKLIFNKNINYLTGKNGVGKTTIIDAIIYLIYKSDDSEKTVNNNIMHINDQGDVSKTNPSIKLIVNFDNQDIKLELYNKKFYIDDIEESKYDSYKKRLAKILNIKDLSFLFNNIIPGNSLDIIESKASSKSNELKKSFLIVANIKNGYIIEQSSIDEINNNITNINDELKNKKNEKKVKEDKIKFFEDENQNIDFNTINEDDISSSKIELKKEEYEIRKLVSSYKTKNEEKESIKLKISDKKNEKDVKTRELEKLNFSKEDSEKYKIDNEKE